MKPHNKINICGKNVWNTKFEIPKLTQIHTVDPWTAQGLGGLIPGAFKNLSISLQSALHTCGFTFMDSTNYGCVVLQYVLTEKNLHISGLAQSDHVVQRSTVVTILIEHNQQSKSEAQREFSHLVRYQGKRIK